MATTGQVSPSSGRATGQRGISQPANARPPRGAKPFESAPAGGGGARPPKALPGSGGGPPRKLPEVINQELVVDPRTGRVRYKPVPPAPHEPDPYAWFVKARDAGRRSAALGPDAVPHFPTINVGKGERFSHLAGRQNGWQSADGLDNWRLDISEDKSLHINWKRTIKGETHSGAILLRPPPPAGVTYHAVKVGGQEEVTYFKLLEGHFGPAAPRAAH